MRRALGLVLLLLLAGPAAAQKAPAGPHREGDYGGVTPGQRPEKPKKPPARGTLSWVGFEATGGGAKVFFQSPGAFEVTQRVDGATLIVHLDLARMGANTGRRIDTRFFENPLSSIDAKQARRKAGIDVKITFKNPKDARAASLSTKTEADGMFYAYLTFPEGTPVAPGAGPSSTNKTSGDDLP
ncbi:MAG: hypothetical protein JNL83_15830 [Myxococcales bacterium]|nr:hypothetical protein [Myxococcales bacterium]